MAERGGASLRRHFDFLEYTVSFLEIAAAANSAHLITQVSRPIGGGREVSGVETELGQTEAEMELAL